GEIRTFKNRWPGQDRFADLMEKEPWIFALKARKLGLSEIECAWDGYVAITQPRARVHLFSRREDAAADLKQRVEFGLKALPDGLRLPVLSSSYLQLTIGHETDKRTIVAYPASPETAVEQTCNHGHVDEYARMGTSDRDRVLIWQAIRPTMAGSCHVVTTGRGPDNAATRLWLQAKQGKSRLYPFFVPYNSRPGRDDEWYEQVRGDFLTEASFRQEYPLTEEDALMGDASYWFPLDYRQACHAKTKAPPQPGWLYWHGWDIAETEDYAVGLTMNPYGEIVEAEEFRVPYVHLKRHIEERWERYGGIVRIEKNGPGAALGGLLNIPQKNIVLVQTTGANKPRMIQQLRFAVQDQVVSWDPDEWPWLEEAMASANDAQEHTPDAVIAFMEVLDSVLYDPLDIRGQLQDQFRRNRMDSWDRWNKLLND